MKNELSQQSENPLQENKALIILTNFWDAEFLLDKRILVESSKVIKLDDPQVYSIALSHPSFAKLPNIELYFRDRLNFFCPTYDMLKDYKENKSWEEYVKRYRELLIGRKVLVKNWIKDLPKNKVYLLCCWEDTSGKAHCHREILYKAFINSEFIMKNINPIYRTGKKTYNELGKSAELVDSRQTNSLNLNSFTFNHFDNTEAF
jgi:hypothetical protein